MNANEVYKLKPISVNSDLWDIVSHLDELTHVRLPDVDPAGRITLHTYTYFDFDGRRTWCLKGLYFDDQPCAIFQSAGREGDDHRAHFITNRQVFIMAMAYLETLNANGYQFDVIDPEVDMPELTNFYGCELVDILAMVAIQDAKYKARYAALEEEKAGDAVIVNEA